MKLSKDPPVPARQAREHLDHLRALRDAAHLRHRHGRGLHVRRRPAGATQRGRGRRRARRRDEHRVGGIRHGLGYRRDQHVQRPGNDDSGRHLQCLQSQRLGRGQRDEPHGHGRLYGRVAERLPRHPRYADDRALRHVHRDVAIGARTSTSISCSNSSPSMAIASTQTGINTMVSNTSSQGGCAFGCHESHPSSDSLGNPGGEDNYRSRAIWASRCARTFSLRRRRT